MNISGQMTGKKVICDDARHDVHHRDVHDDVYHDDGDGGDAHACDNLYSSGCYSRMKYTTGSCDSYIVDNLRPCML